MGLVLVACLAVYGLLMLVWQVWHRMMSAKRVHLPAVIVIFEHSNDWIEWFIRKVSLECYALGLDFLDILIVDVSGCAETSQIVGRLQRSYPYVTYIPSSQERRWIDVLALLQSAQRSQALLVEIRDEAEMHQAVRMITQIAP